jgi:hypothetical protein
METSECVQRGNERHKAIQIRADVLFNWFWASLNLGKIPVALTRDIKVVIPREINGTTIA